MKSCEHLERPGKIGSMTTRNRIVMPPMVTNFAGTDGFVTRQHIDYYRVRARGGVGYITCEHTSISKQGKLTPRVTLMTGPDHVKRFRRLAEAVHTENCPLVIQINHAGRQASPAVTGEPVVAPSPIPCPVRKEMPRELTPTQIQDTVLQYAAAAQRVRESGADGVEVQLGHGSLICSFLSPLSNHREDDYGGSLENRARFALEILCAIRKRVGNDFPVICRVSGKEFVDGGLELDDTVRYSRFLETEGASAIHVSAATAVSIQMNHPPYYVAEGVHVPLARGVKQAVSIPVIAVGRIRDPRYADAVLTDGDADFITMGRALIADPELPQKAFTGRFDDIVPCLSCNRCLKSIREGSLACAVNPEVGREGALPLLPADPVKRVMVVGGGPGGMTAAQTAARRGHTVSLYEQAPSLGGRVNQAAAPPGKSVFNDLVLHQTRRLADLGVEVHCATPVTPELIKKANPDTLIVATGARQVYPRMSGLDKIPYFGLEAVFSGTADLGAHTVILGGGEVGAEVADYISETGVRVTIVEMRTDIATGLVPHLTYFLKRRLNDKQVRILTGARVTGFDTASVRVLDTDGEKSITGVDSVVFALGLSPRDELVDQVKDDIPEIHVVGDARVPREILDATAEGYAAGKMI